MTTLIALERALVEWFRSPRRMTLLASGVLAVGLYETARTWYRPFIYLSGTFDFHIADTLGNSLGTVATVLVFASIFGRTHIQSLFVLRAAAIAVAFYELAHPLLGKVIDPYDLAATVIVGFTCQYLYGFCYRCELRTEVSQDKAC